MTRNLALGPIPLNIGTRERPSNAPFPDELPFTAHFDAGLGIITQAFEPRVAAILDEVYVKGSQLGIPMNDYGLGKATCDDFISFLLSVLGSRRLHGLKVLEIGCGTGYLLTQLQALGADPLGIEPGAASSVHAESAGIPVIHEPFEQVGLKREFDLVLHTGVLEHVRAPADFLRRQLSVLRPGGRVVFAVPDCDPPLTHGDLSMFVHEHWSYFTCSSVASLVAAAGGNAVVIRKAGIGGALYVGVDPTGSQPRPALSSAAAADDFETFAGRAARGGETLAEYFAQRRGVTVGIYCPGRFLNYWRVADGARLRFFDDDIALHDRYFPPIPVAVESRASLLSSPVDSLLIMSRTFGPALADALRREPCLAGREVLTVAELF